jgi:hypothetical protein
MPPGSERMRDSGMELPRFVPACRMLSGLGVACRISPEAAGFRGPWQARVVVASDFFRILQGLKTFPKLA